MFCTNCGAKLSDGDKFCPSCGAPVTIRTATQEISNVQTPVNTLPQNSTATVAATEQLKMLFRKRLSIILITLGVIITAVAFVLVFRYLNQDSVKFSRALNSGYRYLEKLEYEKAIASFTKAISIDPTSKEAYIGAADAYIGLVDYEGAADILEQGYEETSDKVILEKVKEIVPNLGIRGWELMERLLKLPEAATDYVNVDISDYPTVRLYYTIESAFGEELELRDLNGIVLEKASDGDEIERKIKSVMQISQEDGINIDLVVDKSGSMEYDLPQVKNILNRFISSMNLDVGDRAEIIAFDSYVMYMCTYTDNRTLLYNGISNMSTYGMTALYDALYEGVQNAGNQPGVGCVIGFTDGMDNMSYHTPEEIIALSKKYSVPVFIIGSGVDEYYTLSKIASETGGWYKDLSTINDLEDVLESIYREETKLYCVEYETDISNDEYAKREVNIFMMNDDYVARNVSSFVPVGKRKEKVHTSRYEFIKDDVSWSEANEIALNKGGHLASINSKSEEDQIINLVKSEEGIQYVWIGAYTSVDSYGNAYGHWVTGEDFHVYENWYPGEPSRTDRDGTPEMYVVLWEVKDEWTWNDERNDLATNPETEFTKGHIGYIIEYETVESN
ncbi:MAG: VWA domain-containing protein [Butyrivibrio sp.]|nr:VWA domain-containing protein [Butyrivibrio sp.]